MQRISVLRLIILITPLLAAGENAERIRAVETGLMPAVVVKGRPAPRHTIQERMKALNVNGVSIAVIQDYQIDWTRSYGLADVSTNRPVTAETLFLAGSISKPVSAAGALSLVEQEKVKLDEDVNSYLKSWKVAENEFTKEQKVTLRRLLSHTAGLTVHGFPGYNATVAVPTVPQILDGVKPANTPPVRVDLLPGSAFRYSGGGYTVAQLMMTDITGLSFPEFMQRTVLAKAGMRQSTFENPLPERLTAVAASGYKASGRAVPGRYHTYPEMAAAGLWTTASDLARFVIEIQKAREARSKLLRQATVEEMLRPEKQNYGLGFGISERDGLKRFAHGGTDVGFQAVLNATVNGRGFIVMTNSENGARLAAEIGLAVAAAYGWPDKPREREAIGMSAEALAKFAGEYQSDRIGAVKIRVEGDHLIFSAPTLGDVILYPQSADTFFALGGIPDLKFAADGTGFTAGNATAKRTN